MIAKHAVATVVAFVLIAAAGRAICAEEPPPGKKARVMPPSEKPAADRLDPRWMRPEVLPERGPAPGEPGPVPPGPLPVWERPRPNADLILSQARRLGLSPQQVSELKARRLAARLKVAELNARREQAQLKLEAALDEETVDLAAVKKLLHEAAEAEAELRYIEMELGVNARELLTAEQRSRLEEILSGAPWRVMGPAPRPFRPAEERRAPEEREAQDSDQAPAR